MPLSLVMFFDTTPATTAQILTEVTSIFTSLIGMVGTVAQTVYDNKILLIFSLVGLATLGIGFFKSLLRG